MKAWTNVFAASSDTDVQSGVVDEADSKSSGRRLWALADPGFAKGEGGPWRARGARA